MIPDWAKLKPVNSITTNNTGNSRMITQEMIEAMARAAYEAAPMGETRNFEWHWIGWEHAPQEKLKKKMQAAFAVAYPMILEHAASAIKAQRLAPTDATSKAHNYGLTAAIAAIRNLKDKTDA